MFVDSATGAVGGGLVGPIMRVGSRANKVIRHSGTRVYQAGAGATEGLIVAGYVTKPMISRPVRMELIAGGVAGLVYDIAYGKSSGSSSERNGTHVGPGGTTPGYKQPSKHYRKYDGKVRKSKLSCPEGYTLVLVKGKPLCRPNGSKLPGKVVRY